MAYKTLPSLDADVTVALGKVDKKTGKPFPKQAEGYYLGFRMVESKKGPSPLHFVQFGTDDAAMLATYKSLKLKVGQSLGVWGTKDLNDKLQKVKPGTMIRITSKGTKPTKNGDMYVYDVEVDEDNTITVDFSDASVAATAETTTADEDDTTSDDDSNSDEVDADDISPEEQQRLIAAEEKRQADKAKVQAILDRSKRSKTA